MGNFAVRKSKTIADMNFLEELKWRGMLHDVTPGVADRLKSGMTTGYVGIDPTADSLHIGHLVSIMMLRHFQIAGHKPLPLIGGATGMIGDPSGKNEERALLSEEVLRHNEKAIHKQLLQFLDFGASKNKAEIVNNYDWMKEFTVLDFLRTVGKHLTLNYMLTKDAVKNRLETGISFTEFSYQLIQAYDFLHLYRTHNCKLQMGGSDQWGNITSGTELIRRITGGEAFAITCPLITKADGSKFGKTEQGNVWLDPRYTSPYHFYQFWLNCSDADVERYIRIFTFFSKQETQHLIEEHGKSPHLRKLQKTLAKDMTIRVHGENEYNTAVEASEILFGKGTTTTLRKLPEKVMLTVLDGVPQHKISKTDIERSLPVVDFLSEKTGVLHSKSEARRALKEGSISINKQKVNEDYIISDQDLINSKYILVQRGKKKYFLVTAH